MVQNHRVWEPHPIPPLASHRNQGEMAHTCRATINLFTAHFDTEDSCGIVLTSGGRTYHLKAGSEVERQQWITALELAKAKAVRMMSSHSGSQRSARRECVQCRGPGDGGAECCGGGGDRPADPPRPAHSAPRPQQPMDVRRQGRPAVLGVGMFVVGGARCAFLGSTLVPGLQQNLWILWWVSSRGRRLGGRPGRWACALGQTFSKVHFGD